MSEELVMMTTVDADFHLVRGEIDLVRLKVSKNEWLETTDGRYVRCDKVVTVWTPSEEEVKGFLDGME